MGCGLGARQDVAVCGQAGSCIRPPLFGTAHTRTARTSPANEHLPLHSLHLPCHTWSFWPCPGIWGIASIARVVFLFGSQEGMVTMAESRHLAPLAFCNFLFPLRASLTFTYQTRLHLQPCSPAPTGSNPLESSGIGAANTTPFKHQAPPVRAAQRPVNPSKGKGTGLAWTGPNGPDRHRDRRVDG